jgi:hypothetical protein
MLAGATVSTEFIGCSFDSLHCRLCSQGRLFSKDCSASDRQTGERPGWPVLTEPGHRGTEFSSMSP